MYTVYKHTSPNGKVYIGITGRNPIRRWGGGSNYSKNEHFYRAILKYGWNNIKHEILYSDLSKEEAEQKETELIAHYKSNNPEFGYNITSGGGCFGKHSDETKRKISNALKGKTPWNKGISTIPWNKGVPATEEQRKRLRELRKGQPSPMKGKHLSEETKKLLSVAHKGKKTGADHPRAKKIICVETRKIYSTIAEASKDTNILSASICHCCKGQTKTAGKLHWQYANDIEEE